MAKLSEHDALQALIYQLQHTHWATYFNAADLVKALQNAEDALAAPPDSVSGLETLFSQLYYRASAVYNYWAGDNPALGARMKELHSVLEKVREHRRPK